MYLINIIFLIVKIKLHNHCGELPTQLLCNCPYIYTQKYKYKYKGNYIYTQKYKYKYKGNYIKAV